MRVKAPFAADNPDFGDVVKLAKDHMAAMEAAAAKGQDISEAGPKDMKHWCYEAVMEAVYGKGIWKYRNQRVFCVTVVDDISCKRRFGHPGKCSAIPGGES